MRAGASCEETSNHLESSEKNRPQTIAETPRTSRRPTTVFEKAKNKYLDREAGMKLRNEIYAMGDSRDLALSVEKFLGRKQSVEPFLEKIGSKPADKNEKPAGPPPPEARQARH